MTAVHDRPATGRPPEVQPEEGLPSRVDGFGVVNDSAPRIVTRQVRSTIGVVPRRRQTMRALGHRRIGSARVHRGTPEIVGMLRVVQGLVEVLEVPSQLPAAREPLLTPALSVLAHDADLPEEQQGTDMTEGAYKTVDGPAVYFTEGEPEVARQYLAAEAHDGFFSIAWATPLTLPGALDRVLRSPFLTRFGRSGGKPQAVFIDERGLHKVSIKKAFERGLQHPEGIQLFRLETTHCTFVYRAPVDTKGQDLAEAGLICSERDDALIVGLVRGTASEAIAAKAESLVARATDVVASRYST